MDIVLDPTSLLLGLLLGIAAYSVVMRVINSNARNKSRRNAEHAREILKRHGISLGLYLPAHHVEDDQLKEALELMVGGVNVALDRQGNFMGAIGLIDSRTKLRLVVDNTKS